MADVPINEVEREAVRNALEILKQKQSEELDVYDPEYIDEQARTWQREVLGTLQADHKRTFVAWYAAGRLVRTLDELHRPERDVALPDEEVVTALAMSLGWDARTSARLVRETARWYEERTAAASEA